MIVKLIYLLIAFEQILLNDGAPQGVISIAYKPMRPTYHPNPGNYIEQIIPPGEPWPARPEDYDKFSQTTKPPGWTTTNRNRVTTTIKALPASETISALIGNLPTESASLLPPKFSEPTSTTVKSNSIVTNAPPQTITNVASTTETINNKEPSKLQNVSALSNVSPKNEIEQNTISSTILYTSRPLLSTIPDENDIIINKLNLTLSPSVARNPTDLLPVGLSNITNRFSNNVTNIFDTLNAASDKINSEIKNSAQNNFETTTKPNLLLKETESQKAEILNTQKTVSGDKEKIKKDNEMINRRNTQNENFEEFKNPDCSSEESFEITRAVEITNPYIENIKQFITGLIDLDETQRIGF